MKEYWITGVELEKVTSLYFVVAESEDHALELFGNGGGNFWSESRARLGEEATDIREVDPQEEEGGS